MRCSDCRRESPEVFTKTGRMLKRCERCRERGRKYRAKQRAADPQAAAAALRQFHRKQRQEALAAYGGRCACCGEDHFEFLTFDHPNGGGRAHRQTIAARGGSFVSWLRREGYPGSVRVLCYNCNSAYGYWGFCPHQK